MSKMQSKKKIKKCKVSFCGRDVHVQKHGLCRAHYDRYRIHGNSKEMRRIRPKRDLVPYPETRMKKSSNKDSSSWVL